MVLKGNESNEMDQHQKFLASNFEIKTQENFWYFPSIDISMSRHGISLSQQKYVL